MSCKLLDAALWHARRGVHVFPLQAGGKMPLAGTHGELDGTRDEQIIRDAWDQRPDANVGAALRYMGCWVLDIDARSDGHLWLEEMPALPDTLTVISASGYPSAHYWWQWDERLDGAHVKGLADGVDIKGVPYGYVLLPPSRVRGKGEYAFDGLKWLDPGTPPEWLISEILSVAHRHTDSPYVPVDCGIESFPLGQRAMTENAVRFQIGAGKWAVRCPNESQHTDNRRARDSSTVLWSPQPGRYDGRLFCSHSHCRHVRSWH